MLNLLHGDCLDELPKLGMFHGCVTDPPYGLEFMGKEWDAPWKYGMSAYGMKDTKGRRPGPGFTSSRNPMCKICHRHKRGSKKRATCECVSPDYDDVDHRVSDMRLFQDWCYDWARAVYDRLLPGAHLIAFGGTRTHHRLMCAIEDAGFEIRDTFMWMYGSGFAKGRDIERAIDIETCELPGRHFMNCLPPDNKRQPSDHVCPSSHAGDSWGGWGTCVKPSYEPIILARKPLQGTVAANVLKHGCGGLNVDACRVHSADSQGAAYTVKRLKSGAELIRTGGNWRPDDGEIFTGHTADGRWPANVIHDGSDEVLAAFAAFGDAPGQLADISFTAPSSKTKTIYGKMSREGEASAERRYTERGGTSFSLKPGQRRSDTGTAARFFPCCPWSEDELRFHYSGKADGADRADSKHPTVKPVSLMRWLVKLITPPSAHILDPFAGSGTTGEAAMLEGFDCTMIERDAKHAADIARRIKRWSGLDLPLFSG